MRCTLFTMLLLLFGSVTAQHTADDFQKNITLFKVPLKDSLDIDKVLEVYKKGAFAKDINRRIYQDEDEHAYWFQFDLKGGEEERYLTISSPYLTYGKVYLVNNDSIEHLHRVSYREEFPHTHIFYRHPVWKIPASDENTAVFIETKNILGRTRLELHLEGQNQFLGRVESEYMILGSYIAFLISMTLILLIFSLLKREYSIIFYALYIVCMLVEFLAGKGLGIQYLWSENSFLIITIRTLMQSTATFLMGMFYAYFYKFNAKQSLNRNIFKWGGFLALSLLMGYAYKAIAGGMNWYFILVWACLKIVAVVFLLNHIYLAIKKHLPVYLAVAFALPILAIVITQSINPLANSSNWWLNFTANGYNIALALEILLFTRYIFGSVIDTQRKYFKLKEASDELKTNFQQGLLDSQEKERRKLLGDVHDSFGGYMAALRLRLLNPPLKDTKEKVAELLESFDTEYRYLLHNLFTPKMDSDNFAQHIKTYCDKMNTLCGNKIFYEVEISETNIDREVCIHLYRMISELLTNAIKHADASIIDLNVSKPDEEHILLKVSDNGVGFDRAKVGGSSYGLKNIQERSSSIHAKLEIETNKGKGTKISIVVPLVSVSSQNQ